MPLLRCCLLGGRVALPGVLAAMVWITASGQAGAAPHPTPPGPSRLPTPPAAKPAAEAVALPSTSPRGRLEPFGRWQPKLSRCERHLPTAAAAVAEPCLAVLVDQRGAGVFRVSWLDASSSQGVAQVLTFVGTLAPGAQPMACRQARCQLVQPFALVLSSVSQSAFDRRGLASALPSAWPATGQCQLERERIQCEARALSGEVWTAAARML